MSALGFTVLDLDSPVGSKNKTATLVTGERDATPVSPVRTGTAWRGGPGQRQAADHGLRQPRRPGLPQWRRARDHPATLRLVSGLGLRGRHQPFVPGDFDSLVIDHEVGSVQHHPHPPSDQPHRHGVVIRADADLFSESAIAARQPVG